MSDLFKRTKILATLGPATFSEEKIYELVMAGASGCRLNFSHGTYEERDQQIEWVRAAAKKKGVAVAILQDLQGPKIRLGAIKDNRYEVKAGDELILDSSVEEHDGSNLLPVQYNLAERMKVGEPLFIFDGKIRSTVTEITSSTAIKIKIENAGVIMSKKGLNLPNTDFGGNIITEKDLADLKYGATRDFDYVALSFVQSASDIKKLKELLAAHGSTAKVIAKIETKKAIETDEIMEAIVLEADGVMIARGDMAVEVGNEIVPIVQRKLVALCRKYAKICIVATQMLGSMVSSPEPTRAEVSDVANAVLQGTDAVMLSEESAMGDYPVEAVKAMSKIIRYTQDNAKIAPVKPESTDFYQNYSAIAEASVHLAEKIDADLIVCQTVSGSTARAISTYRPTLPIFSIANTARVANQLALTYANSAFAYPYSDDHGISLVKELKDQKILTPKAGKDQITAVVVSGKSEVTGSVDSIQIRQV